jgi:diaminohydroxyphosphoribosylaminopyrimidine deaminase/5-amino-6-(5-phosphoribosylamino)uracil reductase
MVGAGTALADDPDLTVRDMGVVRQPVRIVLDRTLRLAPDSRLGRTAREVPVWLVHGPFAPAPARNAWSATGATLVEAPEAAGRLDLPAALQALAQMGLTRILSEGGATLAAALLRAGLVDDLALFSGAVLIGGDGHPVLGDLAVELLETAKRPTLRHCDRIGPDTYALWSVN